MATSSERFSVTITIQGGHSATLSYAFWDCLLLQQTQPVLTDTVSHNETC